jgi:hypothetical protein
VLSPVGTALIGRSVGAVVTCEFPVGQMRHLTVLRVLPDAPLRSEAIAERRTTRTRQASDAPA